MDLSVVSVKVFLLGGADAFTDAPLKRENQIEYVQLQTCGVSVFTERGGGSA